MEHYDIQVERDVAVKMRDGTVLRADIYRPRAEQKFPVLLKRTTYDKRVNSDIGARGAARGYVVILQDCRGRYLSEGDWYPFKSESQDGYDSVEWAAALPYANGKVGMIGGSYVGATQMLAAIAQPPHLAGVFSYITAADYYREWTYQGGALKLWFDESWAADLARDTMARTTVKTIQQPIWKLPLESFPFFQERLFGPGAEGARGLAPYFFDWLAHPSDDDYWKQWSIAAHHHKIQVPVYNVGAWYDVFQGGTLHNFTGLKVNAGNEIARHGQKLLITVGGHAGFGRKVGDIDFGSQAEIDIDAVMLDWYDHLLKGIENQEAKARPVKLFVMGENTWREEDNWPLERARNVRLYLHSRLGANGLNGDGTLSAAPPEEETPDTFTYDPEDPVFTRGGACCGTGLLPGPYDQRPIEARHDVLLYTTQAFEHDCEVTGPVSLELYASSSAVDTDFTAKLVDVFPDGYALNLTDGILRARYRNSFERPEPMNPDEVYKFTIDLWATSNLFRCGHKLRLEISSSNFPLFDRNLNTGEDQRNATRIAKARNTVHHESKWPSALIIPEVPR